MIHSATLEGKAYAFAFDDVRNQESLVHDSDRRTAGITMTAVPIERWLPGVSSHFPAPHRAFNICAISNFPIV
jgi:glycosyl hydrolase family 64 (putative beta-1,3-glucanase)